MAGLVIQRKSWEQGVLALAFLESGDEAGMIRMAKASLVYRSKEGVPAVLDGRPSTRSWRGKRFGGPPR